MFIHLALLLSARTFGKIIRYMSITIIILGIVFLFMFSSASLVVAASMLSSRISHSEENPEQSLNYYDQLEIEFKGELGKETA